MLFIITKKRGGARVIKNFLKKIEETASEAMIAILLYIDNKLDNHDERLDRHKERMNQFEEKLDRFERGFDSTKAEVDSNIDRKKGITKAVLNAIIVGVIAWILSRIGMG